MTIPAPGPGPQCETCQDEPAIISLMQLADWSQLRIGANCAPEVLRGFADSMDGRQTALPDQEVPGASDQTLAGSSPHDAVDASQDTLAPGQPGAAVELTPEQRDQVLAMMSPEDADVIRTVPARAEGMPIRLPSGQEISWVEWLALGGQHEPGPAQPGDLQGQHWSGAGKVVRSTHGHRKPRGASVSAPPAGGDQEGAPDE